jgi:hypothetical protein
MDVSTGERMMVTIHLKGRVTEDGELVFDAPKNLPPGEAKITIELPALLEQDFTADFHAKKR